MATRKSPAKETLAAPSPSSTFPEKTPSEALCSIYKAEASSNPEVMPPGLARLVKGRLNKG